MKHFSMKSLVLAGALAVGWLAGAGASLAQEVTLRLHQFLPAQANVPKYVLDPWADKVEKDSGGRIKIERYPAMQLGGKPPELYRQTQQGITDATFTLPGYTSGEFPMMALTELPGTADSAADGTRKIWKLFDQYLARDFKDTKVLMLWNSDSASLMSRSKPIRTLEDLKGMRIRTPSAAQSAQLEALGATPVDMPANQIYNNLDRGVIDATMIPMSAALDFKLIEVVKYFTVDAPLGRSPFLVAMQRKRYEALAPDLRKIIDDTTGLDMSLGGARSYDKKNKVALDEAKKSREVLPLAAAESQRWNGIFRELVKKQAAEIDKLGLPGSNLVRAYGLLTS
jgi:TRAP-type C4-dicarboxylate transport system substrate-binding protein